MRGPRCQGLSLPSPVAARLGHALLHADGGIRWELDHVAASARPGDKWEPRLLLDPPLSPFSSISRAPPTTSSASPHRRQRRHCARFIVDYRTLPSIIAGVESGRVVWSLRDILPREALDCSTLSADRRGPQSFVDGHLRFTTDARYPLRQFNFSHTAFCNLRGSE